MSEHLSDYIWKDSGENYLSRENLGQQMPVDIYRLFQYSIRDVLVDTYGKDAMIEVFRACGRMAGKAFAKQFLDLTLDLDEFTSSLQKRLLDAQIGVLRFEKFDEETGNAMLTVSEDLDCSGLPVLGEQVCNYDEGFIAGILETYTQTPYVVTEIDCWATGDRVCRFEAIAQ